MRRFLPKALAVLFGTLLALGIGEAVVRLAGAAPEVAEVQRGRLRISANPRLLFEPVPKMEVAGVPSGAEEYRGVSNSLGYRDRDHPLAKPPGVYRIVVLGDSITAGYQVERTEDTFPALLEAALRREGHDAGDAADAANIEVLNFGVTGYNTAQEVETLRSRALRFDPDLVILAYCHNDRRPPDPRILAGLREARGGRAVIARTQVNRALAWSALYRLVRYGRHGEETEEAEETAAGTPSAGDTVEPSLAELAALSRRHRFEVLLAVFPYLPKPYEKEHARHHAWLAERAREHGFHHLDLRPAFRACRQETGERLGYDRYHPTPAGHRCAARALTDAVRGVLR